MDGGEAAADCVRDTRAAASRVRRQAVVAGKQSVSTADLDPVQAADVDLEAMEVIPAARSGLKRRRTPMSRPRASSSAANRPQATDGALPQVSQPHDLPSPL